MVIISRVARQAVVDGVDHGEVSQPAVRDVVGEL